MFRPMTIQKHAVNFQLKGSFVETGVIENELPDNVKIQRGQLFIHPAEPRMGAVGFEFFKPATIRYHEPILTTIPGNFERLALVISRRSFKEIGEKGAVLVKLSSDAAAMRAG